jgi:hypothetical protein
MKRLIAALLLALFFTACSSNNETKNNEDKPKDEYMTGRVSFQKLLIQAHLWAADARPYMLESQYTKGAPVLEGKAGVWRGHFASPSRSAVKAYTWSGVTADDAPERGVLPGTEDTFNPNNISTQPFDLAYIKKDSNDALTVAQEHGGKKITEEDPNQPIIYVLDWNARTSTLIWHVIYGDSIGAAKLRVAVNATTGEFIGVEK